MKFSLFVYFIWKSGMFNRAHKLFDEMSQQNCKRSKLSVNTLQVLALIRRIMICFFLNCMRSSQLSLILFINVILCSTSLGNSMVDYNSIYENYCDYQQLVN